MVALFPALGVPFANRSECSVADTESDLEGEILLRDIDDEIQHDNLAAIWRRYGVWIIALALAILLGVGGWQGWLAWRAHSRVNDATAYEAALTKAAASADSRIADSVAAFATVAGSKGNSYAPVAQLALAATQLKQGKEGDAVASYKALMDDPATDPVFRDLARLLYALHGLGSGVDPAALDGVIAPLADPSNAFHASALEVRGLIDLKLGKSAAAHDIFTGLSADTTAPEGVRARAQTLANALTGTP